MEPEKINVKKSAIDIKLKEEPTEKDKQFKDMKLLYKDLMDLTKFKLSLLNSIGAYSMFYFYAPLAGVGMLNSATFLFAT